MTQHVEAGAFFESICGTPLRSFDTEVRPTEKVTTTQHIQGLLEIGDAEAAEIAQKKLHDLTEIVDISVINGPETLGLGDLLSWIDIEKVHKAIGTYLGRDFDGDLDRDVIPYGYQELVAKFAGYFMLSDADTTTSFGKFEKRHIDPKPTAHGPLERSSREYALRATEMIIWQLEHDYGLQFEIRFGGPKKTLQGGRVVPKRGVAECEFIILDYVRNVLISGEQAAGESRLRSSVDDVGHDINALLVGRDVLVWTVRSINPILANQLDEALDKLKIYMKPGVSRGRFVPHAYVSQTKAARESLHNVISIIKIASEYDQTHRHERPVDELDLSELLSENEPGDAS